MTRRDTLLSSSPRAADPALPSSVLSNSTGSTGGPATPCPFPRDISSCHIALHIPSLVTSHCFSSLQCLPNEPFERSDSSFCAVASAALLRDCACLRLVRCGGIVRGPGGSDSVCSRYAGEPCAEEPCAAKPSAAEPSAAEPSAGGSCSSRWMRNGVVASFARRDIFGCVDRGCGRIACDAPSCPSALPHAGCAFGNGRIPPGRLPLAPVPRRCVRPRSLALHAGCFALPRPRPHASLHRPGVAPRRHADHGNGCASAPPGGATLDGSSANRSGSPRGRAPRRPAPDASARRI